MGVRYSNVLFESAAGISTEVAKERLRRLHRAMELYQNTFIRQATPDYDWDYYYFRMLENFGNVEDGIYGADPQPELFYEAFDCQSREEVQENRIRILDFVYHSALCHIWRSCWNSRRYGKIWSIC